jgi:hypothetical protein
MSKVETDIKVVMTDDNLCGFFMSNAVQHLLWTPDQAEAMAQELKHVAAMVRAKKSGVIIPKMPRIQ